MKLVGIAFIVARTIAWWTLHNWLREFAYRINIWWWVFVMAGIGAAIIALGTINFQAQKAIVAYTVKSPRNE